MSIKIKLIISYLILVILTLSVLGFLIGKKSKDLVFDEVMEKSERIEELVNTTISVRNDLLFEKCHSDLNFAYRLLNNLGDLRVDNAQSIKVGDYNLPVLYAGKQRISLDTKLVDEVKESSNILCAVFLLNDNKMIRVSTNIIKNNQRSVGIDLEVNETTYKKLLNNEEYFGRVIIAGETYVAGMKPILNKDKKVIGVIAVGCKVLNSYLEKTLSDIKVGKTGYIYILDSKGSLVVNPEDKGKNIGNYDFCKKIISTKNGTIEYTYNGVHKLAYYKYFEPWDWYIVTAANYDDLESSSRSVLYITLFSGLIIICFGMIVSLFMTNIIVKPINRLKSYMEIAGGGDLTVRSDIKSRDEIGTLSNSFNNMIAENKRLLEEVVKYDQLKNEFIANMSHELKTPLNIIFSTAQLFSLYISKEKGSNNAEKLGRYTDIIRQNCNRLLRLVNNLIDITKIDSGFMELNLKNENIVEVVEEITISTVEYVEGMSRNIIFDTNIEEKIMAFDGEKVERILLNLISNATKATEPGDVIEVGVYDKGNYVIISVKDTGVGIPDDKIPEIFQRFKQVDSLLNRKHEGSGIGLSIVKSLVEMHKGKIDVKSKYGEGTEFIISLPFRIVSDNLSEELKGGLIQQTNVEKIQIEFSDIYN